MPVRRDISELAKTYHNLVNEAAAANMPTFVQLEVFDASQHLETGWVRCYLAGQVVRCIVDPFLDLSGAVNSIQYVLWAIPFRGKDTGREYIAISSALNGVLGTRIPTLRALLKVATDNVSNPPSAVELTAAYGSPSTVGKGYTFILDDAGGDANVYLVSSNGTSWWYTALTKAT
jgi:hypothetical protein